MQHDPTPYAQLPPSLIAWLDIHCRRHATGHYAAADVCLALGVPEADAGLVPCAVVNHGGQSFSVVSGNWLEWLLERGRSPVAKAYREWRSHSATQEFRVPGDTGANN